MKLKKQLLTLALAGSLLTGTVAYAYEPPLDPLPDLSSYPTRLLVDGMEPQKGDLPLYEGKEIRFPLRTIAENSGYEITWDEGSRRITLSGDEEEYLVDTRTGMLSQKGESLWTDQGLLLEKGRTYVSPDFFDHLEGVSAAWDGATNTAMITTEAPKDNVYFYDLGEGKLDNPTRPDTSYQMQGMIGVPEGEKRPVVIFLHGSHPVQKASENRYDLGFSYLVNQLADAGYLALSMNIAINYSFEDGEPIGCDRTVQVVEQQSQLLKRAIAGEQGIFPCDLTGKGDLSRVILVGHSRAGFDIWEVAGQTKTLGVKGLISAAPAMVSPMSGAPKDLPAGIIIPQYDGDVMSLDGATLFDLLETTKGRTADAELVYLKGGNHAGFSQALVREDPFASQEDIENTMAPEKQQAFFSQYVMDFVQRVLEEGRTPFGDVSDLPDSYGGCEVVIRTDEAEQTVLFQAAAEKRPELTCDGVEAEWVNACSTMEHTAGAFRLPGSFMHYDLLRLRWEKEGASVTLPVSGNLSGAQWLRLDLTQDSSDPLNHKKDQSMIVTLTDRSGKTASVEVPAGTTALQWQEGEVRKIDSGLEEDFEQYSTFTPLGTVRLSLSDFQGIDLAQVKTMTLTFPQASGSVMFREAEMGK